MTQDILLREDKNDVAVLTLNTPKSLNALSDAMLTTLHAELDAIAENPKIRAIILRGTGKAFCAGHDLKEMTAARADDDAGQSYFNDLFSRCGALMQRILTLPQPVIAQVHGIATAAYACFTDPDAARDYIRAQGAPVHECNHGRHRGL